MAMVEAAAPARSAELHVLDPWVGAGTTSAVANERGHRSTGVDINPALVVVCKARLLRSDISESLPALAKDVVRGAAKQPADISEDEPLLAWFAPSSCIYFRSLERSIYRLLVDPDQDRSLLDTGLHRLSSLGAFFYVALFRTVRSLLKSGTTSNPTWIKAKVPTINRAKPRQPSIARAFMTTQASLAAFLGIGKPSHAPRADMVHEVLLGSSTALQIQDRSVDVVVTSPPYCTRIDYAAGVRPELAVLGCSPECVAQLRHLTLGSPTVPSYVPNAADRPTTVAHFLEAVKSHPSKASTTYYFRYFETYFDLLNKSLAELARVVRDGGHAFVVVQDSYYKEVHIDLAQSTKELAQSHGWNPIDRFDFNIGRTMAGVNPKARAYRETFGATETVLVLKRPQRKMDQLR